MPILYLCPDFPFPMNTGGKRVFSSNIDKLVSSGELCHFILFNNSKETLNVAQMEYIERLEMNHNVLSVIVLSREAANFSSIGMRNLFSLVLSFFSLVPRSLYVRRVSIDDDFHRIISDAEQIVVDHAAAFGCIPRRYWFDKRIVYISHNIETKILREQLVEQAGIIRKVIAALDFFKMSFIEKQMLRRVPVIKFISNADMTEADLLTSHSHGEYIYSPFVIPLKPKRWQYTPEMANLRALFVGGTDYFPNFDAAKWLVESFASQFPHVQIELVGKNEELIAYMREQHIERSNVVLHGRVTDEQLESLFLSCTFFISPVTLGSGIKIKVLEAASYGIPILATRESLLGLSFIDGVSLINRSNISCEILALDGGMIEQHLVNASQRISHSVEVKVF